MTIVSYADHWFNAILIMSAFCTYRCKSKIVSEQHDGGHVDTVFGSFHFFFFLTNPNILAFMRSVIEITLQFMLTN